jgi:hypothetical protein
MMDIICDSKGPLNLTSIFDKLMEDPLVVSEQYYGMYIHNEQIEEIEENSLAKMNFELIEIGQECISLKRIHSNAFEYQFQQTKYFRVLATGIVQEESLYNFYDLVNSFHKLDALRFLTNIGILKEKFGSNLNKLKSLHLNVDAIEGSPFSNMSEIQKIDLSYGQLNYITNSAFKLGNTRYNKVNEQLEMYFGYNELNGSSFEKGVFTHQTLKNISIRLFLSDHKISYLDKQVFLPFLSSGKNEIVNLKKNPLDCDNCKSAWICESISVPDGESNNQLNITQFIDSKAKCSDNNRSFVDCEMNFSKCGSTSSSVTIENSQIMIIFIIIVLIVGLFLFGGYFIWKKKKNTAKKVRGKMNESSKESDYDSIGMENEINMTNIYDAVRNTHDYYDLNIHRYDNNDEICYEVIDETNCSVKNDDDRYLEIRSEMK